MRLEPLTAISPIDGRYRTTTQALADYFSERALMTMRLTVESEYLVALSETKGVGLRPLTPAEKTMLHALPRIPVEDAQIIQKIEREGYEGIPATNHDVKAVEYFIKLKLKNSSLADVLEWVHFALTSEDVNSTSHALALRGALEEVMLPALDQVAKEIVGLARAHADTAMLARTHGQSATPTTFGKEMNVFATRLAKQVGTLRTNSVLMKWGGPSANYNAQMVALPQVDWLSFARSFAERLNTDKPHSVRVALNEVTTQIEPHDTFAEMFDNLRRINTILLDLSQDMWRYISDGWVTQKPKEGEVGSSAMPHKVNPIDFENAEGNLGVSNALLEFMASKLPISRLQRDLTDSTVLRNIGVPFAHTILALKSIDKGLSKLLLNEEGIAADLETNWAVVAEAIQTILRREKYPNPYEALKELTRGNRSINRKTMHAFIDGLKIKPALKKELKAITPGNYVGIPNSEL